MRRLLTAEDILAIDGRSRSRFDLGGKRTVLGISIEMSESGMSALMSEDLGVGERVHIEPIAGGKVLALVRRQTGKVYGFEFIDLASAQVQQLREICKGLPAYNPRSLNI